MTSTDLLDQLTLLAELHEAQLISGHEFSEAKSQLLAGDPGSLRLNAQDARAALPSVDDVRGSAAAALASTGIPPRTAALAAGGLLVLYLLIKAIGGGAVTADGELGRFSAPADIQIELEGNCDLYVEAFGVQGFDATLRLRDSDGRELAYDDDSGFDLNPSLFAYVPRSGTYTIELRGFAGRGGDADVVANQVQFDNVAC